MSDPDVEQMASTGEVQDDDGPTIDGWSAFWAVCLGGGFVVHMMFSGIGDDHTPGLHRRLHFFFVILAGVAITCMALAGLARIRKRTAKPPAGGDLD